jgi:hypothetical protein
MEESLSRETDAQMGMIKRQLEHDRDMRALERVHSLITQGAKGLSLLNGGAAVAILAFVQALVDKPAYLCFKPYAVGSLSCFLAGAFLPAIVFFFHFAFLNRPYQETEKREKKFRAVWWLLAASSIFAFIGGVIVSIGVWVVF